MTAFHKYVPCGGGSFWARQEAKHSVYQLTQQQTSSVSEGLQNADQPGFRCSLSVITGEPLGLMNEIKASRREKPRLGCSQVLNITWIPGELEQTDHVFLIACEWVCVS